MSDPKREFRQADVGRDMSTQRSSLAAVATLRSYYDMLSALHACFA